MKVRDVGAAGTMGSTAGPRTASSAMLGSTGGLPPPSGGSGLGMLGSSTSGVGAFPVKSAKVGSAGGIPKKSKQGMHKTQ